VADEVVWTAIDSTPISGVSHSKKEYLAKTYLPLQAMRTQDRGLITFAFRLESSNYHKTKGLEMSDNKPSVKSHTRAGLSFPVQISSDPFSK
jgi:hypothetical protein